MYIQIRELDSRAVAAIEKIKSDRKIKTNTAAVIYAICSYESLTASLAAVQKRAESAEEDLAGINFALEGLKTLFK